MRQETSWEVRTRQLEAILGTASPPILVRLATTDMLRILEAWVWAADADRQTTFLRLLLQVLARLPLSTIILQASQSMKAVMALQRYRSVHSSTTPPPPPPFAELLQMPGCSSSLLSCSHPNLGIAVMVLQRYRVVHCSSHPLAPSFTPPTHNQQHAGILPAAVRMCLPGCTRPPHPAFTSIYEGSDGPAALQFCTRSETMHPLHFPRCHQHSFVTHPFPSAAILTDSFPLQASGSCQGGFCAAAAVEGSGPNPRGSRPAQISFGQTKDIWWFPCELSSSHLAPCKALHQPSSKPLHEGWWDLQACS